MMMMAPIDLLCLALTLTLALSSSAAAVASSSPSQSSSYFDDRFSVSAAAAATTTTTTRVAAHDRLAFVGTAARVGRRRVGRTAHDDDVVGRRRRPERRRRSSWPTSTQFAKKRGDGDYGESDGEKKKRSQRELLLDLESKFDYEGRISSKTSSAGPADSSSDNDALSSSSPPPPQQHRCALLTILGRPNMGKSTLLNALLSDDLAVATNRPQTTRHAILGVLTADAVQLCVTDTPGIIPDPAYRLQVGMMDAVRGAVRSADIFLVVTDVYSGVPRPITNKEGKRVEGEMEEPEEFLGLGEEMLSKLRLYEKPVIVCVNKVDLAVAKDDEGGSNVYANAPAMAVSTMTRWREAFPDAFAIIPTCAADGPDDPGVVALRSMLLANDPDVDVGAAVRGLGRPVPGMFGDNVGATTASGNNNSIGERAREMVPIGPPLYHPDFFTDRTDRFCASEIVRGALFRGLGKELPYCCEVRIESFDESSRWIDDDDNDHNNDSPSPPPLDEDKRKKKKKPMIRMAANILVERDSQKGIVVGKGGTKIREVGTEARRELQEFFGCKVFLELRVKVDKNWRNDDDKLKKYGYMS